MKYLQDWRIILQLFNISAPFSFNYATFDQTSSLFVGAKIYDVSNGTPAFLTTVSMLEIANGFYSGNYSGAIGKTYLVIACVFTDSGLTTLDTSRAPWAECYKHVGAQVTFGPFNYGIFDQETNLFVAANIYNVTTGSSVFVAQVPMAHVFAGVYFGSFTGVINNVYEVSKFVFTDGTYTTISPNFSTGSDSLQLTAEATVLNVTNLYPGQLTGQMLNGTLSAGNFQAQLTGDI